ncbi:MAG: C40 family peptidase [Proteobacteria bacterium]|nr:C40 family peptidase [Pseudomonadota bacterium]
MASTRSFLSARAAAVSGLLLVGLLASGTVWSDPMSGEGSEAPTVASKLKGFTSRASELAMQAMSLLGVRYKRGGNTPDSGLDCSGLVHYVFKEAWGKTLPRTAEELSQVGGQVDKQDLQPGDLVFYHTLRRKFSHVGIYLGNNTFIHAPSSGGQVRIESMEVSYWKSRFSGARRISDTEQTYSSLPSATPTATVSIPAAASSYYSQSF